MPQIKQTLRTRVLAHAFVIGTVATIVQGDALADDADVIVHNGKIYTVNESRPWAEALAIKDGRFVVVGSDEDVKSHLGDKTEVIDLKGRFVMPGLVEAHTHGFEDYHKTLFQLAVDTASPESLLRSVKKYAADNPEKKWITGGMWPSGMFPGDSPSRKLLDEVVPDRPIMLIDQSAHSAWLNTKAIEISGLADPAVKLDPRAVVERDDDGYPSGTIREYAIGHVRRYIDPVPASEWEETCRQMQKVYQGYGFTATRLASGNLDHVRAARKLEDQGELNMNLSIALNYEYFDSPATAEEQLKDIKQADQFLSELVDPRCVKLFLDGTQLGRSAWNNRAYPGEPENFGTGYYSPLKLTKIVDMFTSMDRSVIAHGCGSRSVREFLNAIEFANGKHPEFELRHHPTHNIQISPADLGRFKKLDVAAEVSPIMIMNPGLLEMISSKVGRETLDNGMWRLREIIDSGSTLAIASDWNVSPLNPWNIMEYVVTRENDQFPEMGKIAPTSAITVAEAIRAYTYGGAYAIGKEDRFGTIEPGKDANLVVLDRDLLELEKAGQNGRINETEVLYTVFKGKIVYRNLELTTPARNGHWSRNR